MKTSRLRIARRLPPLCLLAALSGCAGYQYHTDGMKLASEGKGDAALPLLRLASQADPLNGEYRIDLLRETAQYVGDLLVRADEARRSAQPEVAADLYNKVLRVEPANDRARRGLDAIERDARSTRLLGDAESLLRDEHVESARTKVDAVLAADPSNATARRLQLKITDATEREREAKATALAMRSVMNKPVTLQFRDANLRMVFEALSRTTGLNVILDRDVRADLKTTIFVGDALQLVGLEDKLPARGVVGQVLTHPFAFHWLALSVPMSITLCAYWALASASAACTSGRISSGAFLKVSTTCPSCATGMFAIVLGIFSMCTLRLIELGPDASIRLAMPFGLSRLFARASVRPAIRMSRDAKDQADGATRSAASRLSGSRQ